MIEGTYQKCYYQCLNKGSCVFFIIAASEPNTTKNDNIPKIIPLTLIMNFRKEISIDRRILLEIKLSLIYTSYNTSSFS